MARAKIKLSRRHRSLKWKHTKNSKDENVYIPLQAKTSTAKSATTSCSGLQEAISCLSQICKSQAPPLSATEVIQVSRKHQTPILSLLKSIDCSVDKKHTIALKIPEILLSDKERSDMEISSRLVRDHEDILKWAVLSSEFGLKQRQNALQYLCRHLKNSHPKKKSLRFWTEHFLNDNSVHDGFRLDSVLTFGKALPADLSGSAKSQLLNGLLDLNEIGFARLFASETNMHLNDELRTALSLGLKPFRIPPGVELTVIDTEEKAIAAGSVLLGAHVVGVDTETQPQYRKGGRKNPVSIIQIATLSQVFIFDLLSSVRKCAPVLSKILRSPSIIKIGLGLQPDFVHLHSAYPDLNFGWAASVIDLNDIFLLQYPGASIKSLARLTLFCTGQPLAKGQQMSNWARRPLTDAQRHYAALDAFVCLRIASSLTNSELTDGGIYQACQSLAKPWEYSISDDPGCMWVRPW